MNLGFAGFERISFLGPDGSHRFGRRGLAVMLLLLLSVFANGLSPRSGPPGARSQGSPLAVVPKIIDASPLARSEMPYVNVFAAYSEEPAPMGIADYGVGPSGGYEYSTNSSIGSVTIDSLAVKNATGSTQMSIQLNVNLEFYNANKPYVYWVQDVAEMDTSTNAIDFIDNIWNSSTRNAAMSGSAVSGNGRVYPSGDGSFYFDGAGFSVPGNDVDLAYPATVELRVNSSLSSANEPEVTFEYDDGHGWQEYDSVAFTSARDLTSFEGFVVDGFDYKPGGFFDSELILGGPGSGSQTTDVQSDVALQLEYWNGHNYQVVTNAYNFGSDTAEGIQGALSEWGHYPSDGEVVAEVQSGAGSLGKLWDQSGVSIVDLKTTLASGTLDVGNSSLVGSALGAYPFINGEVTVTLEPGSYSLDVYSGASLFTAGKYTLTAGELLELHTPLGITPLTLSFSITGGGSGYSAPTLTYVYNGAAQTASLGTTPTVYDLDSGSAWSVTPQLPGSTGTERWETSQSTAGIASSPQGETIAYYHQYQETVSFSVAGGGSGYSPPSLAGQQFGSSVTLPIGSSPVAYWLDSDTAYSATNPLGGSTSTERWFAPGHQGTVTGADSVAIAYAHQYLLTLTGGSLGSQWYDSGTEAVVTEPDTYGRSSGTGQRVTYFELDSGQQTPVAPYAGNFTVPVVMDAPHAISFTSVTQYEVTLDATAAQALSSITPPTVSGDSYWYDSGSQVSVALDGTWGRSAGVGERLVSYSVNGGGLVPVDSVGPVTVLALPAISSPQLVAGRSTTQFLLDTSGGSLASISPTPISGDAGWYDSQTVVTAVYDYSWNGSEGQSRLNAISYSVDRGEANVLARRGNGTFPVTVTMDAQHQIGIGSVAQYLFAYSGGFNVTLSSASPTADGFYDANSSVTVTSNYVGDVIANQEREVLTGYALDSATKGTPQNDTGTFTTPPIVFDTYHTLAFQSVAQYFVAFAFTDSSGLDQVTPSSLGIDEGALGQHEVAGLGLWMDNGTTFTVSSVMWEGEDVKPLNLSPYQVSAPANITLDSRVYAASMKVSDLLGLAVQGARVAATLVNGTTVTGTTNSSGLVSFGLVPIGPYKASISYLGLSTSTSADASVRSEASSTLVLSVPVIGVVFAVAAVALGVLSVRRRSRSNKGQRSVEDDDHDDYDR